MIPKTTHQQNAVLSILSDGTHHFGRDIRKFLKEHGYRSTDASFYEMMDRLEGSGMVEGELCERIVQGETFRGKAYKIKAPGMAAWNAARDYYIDLSSRLVNPLPGRA